MDIHLTADINALDLMAYYDDMYAYWYRGDLLRTIVHQEPDLRRGIVLSLN